MHRSRRDFTRTLAAAAALSVVPPIDQAFARAGLWHERIADRARALSRTDRLRLLIPHGSAANVKAATDEFTRLSGIECVITEVPVDDMNIELVLRANAGDATIDVALPATFGIPDLVKAGAIAPLDAFARQHEPEGFSSGYLYRNGDYYQGRLYGYQTDGDVYVMFYNKRLLEDLEERRAYERLTGRALRPARTWGELDAMMAFFHRPERKQYGGCLFRNADYLVWEWWARFHSKGYFPVSERMEPNVNNAAGVAALNELIAASAYQSPASRTNDLFANWADFSEGNTFCNIGWGGTQKHLMGTPTMRENLVHSALPGVERGEGPAHMGYFNWGWNYTLNTHSRHKEPGYLLALFCTSPVASTLAVREPGGYFDPFRKAHYADPEVESVYGRSFLDAHRLSMSNSIPDFYISAQSSYLNALRQQILTVVNGEASAQQALDVCAQKWNHLTRRLGVGRQREQWRRLRASYPASIRDTLLSS